MDAFEKARGLIDRAHSADPARAPDGRPGELAYADRMEKWVLRINPQADPVLLLAARCQHLERWLVPRASFPMDRIGYLAWRTSLYGKQAERARSLLMEAGLPQEDAEDAATWVAKKSMRTNPGTQALEDAAVLVFLQSEIESFAAQHAEYPREKFVDILRKTWRKMSPRAQELARGLELPRGISSLVREATGG
jgi:tRNAThr (cytosine32-N3)-methyltransferase